MLFEKINSRVYILQHNLRSVFAHGRNFLDLYVKNRSNWNKFNFNKHFVTNILFNYHKRNLLKKANPSVMILDRSKKMLFEIFRQ